MTRPLLSCLLLAALAGGSARADDLTAEHRAAIKKGLDWVVKNQMRDGHWEGPGGQFPTSMTALSAMALLMEGSTLREGKYAEHLRKATDWLMDRCMRNGMIGNPTHPMEAQRYMYGHGFGMLFLASVYGEEEDGDRRKKLEEILNRGVEFTGKAQTPRGGWGYLTSADGNGFDEGSVTITQVQALRAARNAGIVVPKSIIDKAHDYLQKCTTDRGGVIYSLAYAGRGGGMGGERAPLTAAAVACLFNSGEYTSEYAKKWLKYCQGHISVGQGRTGQHDEYTHYYYAQVNYVLGEDRFEKLFPDSKPDDRLTWSKYRKSMFDYLVRSQNPDGSWNGGYVGPVFATAVYLTVLQLDNAALPIYQK
jgi:squalene cyclase